MDAAEQINCPHLVIEAEEGAKFCPDLWDTVMEVYKKNNMFKHVVVPGTHHVHIDDPVVVATVIQTWWGELGVRSKL